MTFSESLKGFRWFALLAAACLEANAATTTVTTVAGGYIGDGKPATSSSLAQPTGVARDSQGNLYVSDTDNCRIRVIDAAGIISTFAGTGICGFSGDGGPAKSARISNPFGIALDPSGNLLVTDGTHIRKITPGGIISTVAGNGRHGYSGDGGPATKASLNYPMGVFGDPLGNIYIADSANYVVRKINAKGIISTVAGNHTAGFSGDGGPATSASLRYVFSVVADGKGSLYIADGNERVRIVNPAGIINTYAGNGMYGNTGSGGPATSASIGSANGLLLGDGKLYISTGDIWAVDLSTQVINITAGNGTTGFNGDGNTALSTSFSGTSGMAFDGAGGLLVVDSGNARLRRIASTQIVSTVAGGYVGDGAKATAASLNLSSYPPPHIAFDAGGNLYIADGGSCRVRKVSPPGIISTFAGTGICGYSGDGGPATSATLFLPAAVAADGSGNVYIADTGNNVIRRVDSAGTITTFLTTLTASNGFTVPARANALAVDRDGILYASDGTYAIWKITPSASTTVIAGELYDLGYNGDGIPATQAWLFLPNGVAVDSAGNVYISDWLNQRIRKVDTTGIISTVAGNGTEGFSGDGGPATSAMLSLPTDVAVDRKGNFYIADWDNFRVRIVDPSGTIETLAGSGSTGYNGNNLPASQATLFPTGLAVESDEVYVADQDSFRVREIH